MRGWHKVWDRPPYHSHKVTHLRMHTMCIGKPCTHSYTSTHVHHHPHAHPPTHRVHGSPLGEGVACVPLSQHI